MSQYRTILQEYDSLKSFLDTLFMSDLSPEQKVITDKIHALLERMDKKLFENYIDFEEICDNLPEAIYVADKDGTTIYINDMYQQMSGITKGEIIGENIHQINLEKKLYTNGIIPTVLKNAKRSECIGHMTRTDTSVYITGFPIFDINGNLRYAVAHDRNIRQLEEAKDQLLKMKEAQEKQEEELHYLRMQQTSNNELIFRSPQMTQAVTTALTVAPTNATVLLTGESGTGKEVITNQIYQASSRKDKPFLKINCAAIPDNLMESELFGYMPGSFTGASKNGKIGIFELANGGTLMLDEIGEMSIPMQTKLLRVLQNHEIMRIGGNKPIPVDVRIIAATNKDLLECIKDHTFREDLYYRLNVIPIQLAPLRERKKDIEALVQHFLAIYNKKYNKHLELSSDALHRLESYSWPGNIRELENVIERLVIINHGVYIDKSMICKIITTDADSDSVQEDDFAVDDYNIKAATAALERKIILRSLSEFDSKRQAAKALGIDHSTLIKKCQKYGI